ncbi:hypothetical protein, partial [Adonisia turfae]|uniref:hypothetical protein n=1 Tax=Adonisia turfae TaxID=2950184 RepID=UPI002029AA30
GTWRESASTLEEYLTNPYPNGAGVSKEVLAHAIKAPFRHQLRQKMEEFENMRREVIEALTPEDAREGNFNGNQYTEKDLVSGHDVPKPLNEAEEKRQKRARAIARAPQIARELYHSDLLGQNEAVKLGPRVNQHKPTPKQLEVKEQADKIGAELEKWVEENPAPMNLLERPQYKRKATEFVRERLSGTKRITVSWTEGVGAEEVAGKLFERLDHELLVQVVAILNNALVDEG